MTEQQTRSLMGCNFLTSRDGMKTVKLSRVASWEIEPIIERLGEFERPLWEIRARLAEKWFVAVAAFPSPEMAIEAKRQLIIHLNSREPEVMDWERIERMFSNPE